MSNSSKKSIKGLLAVIGIVGAHHASANAFEIKNPEQKASIIKQLVEQRLLIPLHKENWYQVNQERLEAALKNAEIGNCQAKLVIDMLQALIGADVNIKYVELFDAHLGTQDYAN